MDSHTNNDAPKLFGSFITEPYLLQDCVEHFPDGDGGTLTRSANEVTLLMAKQLPPEVVDRLGLVSNRITPVYGSTGSRYVQSICDKYDNLINTTDALGNLTTEYKNSLPKQDEDSSTVS